MVRQVMIKRFKSIKDLTIDLRLINILIGCNGVGKSNFVAFFELLSKLCQQQLGSYVMEHDGADMLLYNGSKNSESIKGLFNFDNTNAFYFTLKPTAGDKLYVEETGDYFNGNKHESYDYPNWSKNRWDTSVQESEIMSNKTWRAGYVQKFLQSFTVYHFHDTSSTSRMRKPCTVEDNAMLRHDASNLPAYLYKLQQTAPKEFAMIEAVIRQVAPYFKQFVLQPSEVQPDKIFLKWEEYGTDAYRDATNLSDGTLRFIALTTLLLQPNKPQTIVIDEPELGLHPSAINILSGLIKAAAANGCQVIAATQSVNLVNCFEPEDILVSDRRNGQTTMRHLEKEEWEAWIEDYNIGTIWEKNIIGGRP